MCLKNFFSFMYISPTVLHAQDWYFASKRTHRPAYSFLQNRLRWSFVSLCLTKCTLDMIYVLTLVWRLPFRTLLCTSIVLLKWTAVKSTRHAAKIRTALETNMDRWKSERIWGVRRMCFLFNSNSPFRGQFFSLALQCNPRGCEAI